MEWSLDALDSGESLAGIVSSGLNVTRKYRMLRNGADHIRFQALPRKWKRNPPLSGSITRM